MESDKYINKSQEDWCRVWEALAVDNFPELTLSEIAAATGISTDKVFRTLHLMNSRGYVEKNGERYRFSRYWPKLGHRYGEQLIAEIEQAKKRLQEFGA